MENNLVLTTVEAAEFLKLTPFTVRIMPGGEFSGPEGGQGVALLSARPVGLVKGL